MFCDEAGSKNSVGILESYSKRVRSARAAPGAVNTGQCFLFHVCLYVIDTCNNLVPANLKRLFVPICPWICAQIFLNIRY